MRKYYISFNPGEPLIIGFIDQGCHHPRFLTGFSSFFSGWEELILQTKFLVVGLS